MMISHNTTTLSPTPLPLAGEGSITEPPISPQAKKLSRDGGKENATRKAPEQFPSPASGRGVGERVFVNKTKRADILCLS